MNIQNIKLNTSTHIKQPAQVFQISEKRYLELVATHPKEANACLTKNEPLYAKFLLAQSKLDRKHYASEQSWKGVKSTPFNNSLQYKAPSTATLLERAKQKQKVKKEGRINIGKDKIALRVLACADQRMSQKNTMLLVGISRHKLRAIVEQYDEIVFFAPHTNRAHIKTLPTGE